MSGPPPVGSLHDLAEQRLLPDHQRMDHATLDWISAQPPEGPEPPTLPSEPPLLPVPRWFATTQGPDGIHGLLHNARVSHLAAILAAEHQLAPEVRLALRVAAAVHDCRRLTDRDDPDHGRRAGQWFLHHHQTVTASTGHGALPEDLVALAATAVAQHASPPRLPSGQELHDPRGAEFVTRLLRTADALDRYRLPLTRWWPDHGRLQLQPPAWLPRYAHRLVVTTERARLDGATHRQALGLDSR
ncbi:hypothetical protein ABH932_004656 [Streptacidiphilus sp. MAP5-52]